MPKARAVESDLPSIERRAGLRGGAPVIAGTGVRVLDVAVRYELMQMAPEEILVALPHLTLPQVHAALSYYYVHKAELDREWKRSLSTMRRLRRTHASALERQLGPLKNLHG